MSTDDIPSYLALPSSPDTGSIRLFDLLTDGGNLLLEIGSHISPLVSATTSKERSKV